jgi:hypothetical protein
MQFERRTDREQLQILCGVIHSVNALQLKQKKGTREIVSRLAKNYTRNLAIKFCVSITDVFKLITGSDQLSAIRQSFAFADFQSREEGIRVV